MSLGAALFVLLAAFPAATAQAVTYDPELVPGGSFVDDDGHFAEGAIEALATAGITRGCNADRDRYCPERAVTRGELATFLARAVTAAPAAVDAFDDDAGNPHEQAINDLAAAGVTVPCAPGRFCPELPATRADTAVMLVRAFGYTAGADLDAFVDDSGLFGEPDINRLAAAGITAGCTVDRFCPYGALTRGQVAMFLVRALGLPERVPQPRPAPPAPAYPAVGSGKRIIYSNSEQRVWLIDENEKLVDTYPVSGRVGVPSPATYSVYSKSVDAVSNNGITMKHMVRFAHGPTLPYGFHSIPLNRYGQPLQTVAQLGQPLSGGCVRQQNEKAVFLFNWAPIGTTVIVLP